MFYNVVNFYFIVSQGISIIVVESLPPFALSPSKGRPEWLSKLITNGLEELPPTIERPCIGSCASNMWSC